MAWPVGGLHGSIPCHAQGYPVPYKCGKIGSGNMERPEWIIDLGHGWLRVPVETCEGLRVSEYSYIDRRAGVIYLEEDCDAGVWLHAHGANASDYRATFLDGDAPCRMLPRVPVSVAS